MKLSCKLSLVNSHATLGFVWSSNESWWNSHVNSRLSTLIQLVKSCENCTYWGCDVVCDEMFNSLELALLLRLSNNTGKRISCFVPFNSVARFLWRKTETQIRESHQLSLLDQTRTRVAWELTSESLHESFINFHCLIKREQELHESWQARVYMRVSSTFIAWSNENKSCMRVDKQE